MKRKLEKERKSPMAKNDKPLKSLIVTWTFSNFKDKGVILW